MSSLSRLGVSEYSAHLVPSDIEQFGAATRPYLSVKSLAVFAVGEPVVAVLPSHRKLDPFKLARHLKLALTSRKAMSKQVRLATPDECVRVFGFRPGTVPPVGHRAKHTLSTSVDESMVAGSIEPRGSTNEDRDGNTIAVIVDRECAESSSTLLGGGGDFGTLLHIEAAALLGLPFCAVADITDTTHAEHGGAQLGAMGTEALPGGSEGAGVCCGEPGPDRVASVCSTEEPNELRACEHAASSFVSVTHGATKDSAAYKKIDDASSEPLRLHEPRFLVDAMMGRLLRWLRVLGVDTLLREESESLAEVFTRAVSHERKRAAASKRYRLGLP